MSTSFDVISLPKRAYVILFLFAAFMMLTGDFPRFPFGIQERYLPLLIISSPRLYPILFCGAFLGFTLTGGLRFRELEIKRVLLTPLIAVSLAFLFSAAFSVERSFALRGYMHYLTLVFFAVMIGFLLNEDEVRKRIPIVIGLAILFLAIRVIFWRLDEGLHIGSYHVKNNSWLGKLQIAWVLNLTSPYLMTRFVSTGDRFERVASGAAWMTAGVAIFLLFSRAGIITFLISTLLLLILLRSEWRKWLWLLAGLVLFTSPFLLKGSSMTGYVLRTTARFYEQEGFVRRLGIWKESLRMFKDNPLLGIGFGTYDDIAYSRYKTPHDLISGNRFHRGGWHAHSVILHILAETGLLGFLSCCYLFYKILDYLVKRYRNGPPSARLTIYWLSCSLLALFILSLTENILALRVHESMRSNVTLWFLILYGLESASVRKV